MKELNGMTEEGALIFDPSPCDIRLSDNLVAKSVILHGCSPERASDFLEKVVSAWGEPGAQSILRERQKVAFQDKSVLDTTQLIFEKR